MHIEPTSWDDLRILLAVYRQKSFLAAGKTLGLATSTVARRMEALERTLGRPVVHRSTGGTQIDPDVLRLVALGESLELGLGAILRDAGDEGVAGVVRVSVAEGFVRPTTRLLARLRVKHPGLFVELVSESRMADIARREVDIGIRITRSSSATLIEKSLGKAAVALFASRDYVERRLPAGRISRELARDHDWVGLDKTLEHLPQEKWMRTYGAERFVFRSTSNIAVEQAIQSGMGIGLLGVVQGEAIDGLVKLDADAAPPSVDVYLAFHRDAKKTPRVRVVVRELEAEVRRQLGC